MGENGGICIRRTYRCNKSVQRLCAEPDNNRTDKYHQRPVIPGYPAWFKRQLENYYIPEEKSIYYRGVVISSNRYKYMSIRQLQDIADELREESKRDPSRDVEYYKAYKALEDKIRERDRKRPRCIPTRFEHSLDLMEEF